MRILFDQFASFFDNKDIFRNCTVGLNYCEEEGLIFTG